MIKKYVLSIIVISISGLFFDTILPEGNIRKYGNYALSVIMSIALIQPVVSFFKNDFNMEYSYEQYVFDYTEAVKSTVNSISGYEDADVYVEQSNNKIESITIYQRKDKLLEKAEAVLKKDFVKTMLKNVYGTENIYFSE